MASEPAGPTMTSEFRWKRFITFVRTKNGGRGHVSWQRVCLLARAEGYTMVRYDSGPFREHDQSEPFVMVEADWMKLPTTKPESSTND